MNNNVFLCSPAPLSPYFESNRMWVTEIVKVSGTRCRLTLRNFPLLLRPNVKCWLWFLYNNIFCLEYSVCECHTFRSGSKLEQFMCKVAEFLLLLKIYSWKYISEIYSNGVFLRDPERVANFTVVAWYLIFVCLRKDSLKA